MFNHRLILERLEKNLSKIMQSASDPGYWALDRLGIDLYDNQLEILNALYDLNIENLAILEARGSGKSFVTALGIVKLCSDIPKFKVGVFGPKTEQATRIIKVIKEEILTPSSPSYNIVRWKESTTSKLTFVNGSEILAISAAEATFQEGHHFHLVVLDENHRIADISVNQRIIPMLGSFPIAKMVKIGISMYKNNFWKSCCHPNTMFKVIKHDWTESPILLRKGSIIYKGKELPKYVIDQMPLTLKEKMFPDRPDLHYDGNMTELDFKTQYAMEWAADINLELNEEDQQKLVDSTHEILTRGKLELQERYFFGLDTAAGTILPGRKDLDFTALSIWRKRGDNIKEKVACLTGDVKIPLLNGKHSTIEELCHQFDKPFWVYSYDLDTHEIVPGLCTKVWQTGIRNDIYEITLDNGDLFKCTADHKIMMRNSTYKEAKDLQPNDSLMPLYRDTIEYKRGTTIYNPYSTKLGVYERIWQPSLQKESKGKWIPTHVQVMLAEKRDELRTLGKRIIHHQDFNSRNNTPDNLKKMTPQEHIILHTMTPEQIERISQKTKQVMSEPKMRQNISKKIKASWTIERRKQQSQLAKTFPHTLEWREEVSQKAKHCWKAGVYDHLSLSFKGVTFSENRKQLIRNGLQQSKKFQESQTFENLRKRVWKMYLRGVNIKPETLKKYNLPDKNHKVIQIKKINIYVPVYDLSIEKYHNFAISGADGSGVFVHNCYQWQGNVLDQMKEIRQIVHPTEGFFSCVFGLVDYSNIGINIVEAFKTEGIPVEGIMFSSTEMSSHKNFKNAMFDQFKFELQSGRIKYPSLEKIDKYVVFKKSFNEWMNIERHKSLGINDKINAPSDFHDDHCSGDVLAIWAADKTDTFKVYGVQSTYKIPDVVTGVTSVAGRGVSIGQQQKNRYLPNNK